MPQGYQAVLPNASECVTVRPEDIVPSFMPSLLVAAEKDAAPQHKRLDRIHRYRFWHPNVHKTTWALIIDLDTDDWLIPLLEVVNDHPRLRPSWIIEKAENGHGQVAWIIDRVNHGPKSRRAPQDFARDVRRALTNAFDADPHFTNARCWNPFWTGWEQEQAGKVFWGHTTPRPLGQLKEPLMDAGRWDTTSRVVYTPSTKGTRTTDELPGSPGRNEWIFHTTRLRPHGTVAQVAHDLNDELADPLDVAELNGIIRSIERYEASGGRKPGSAMTAEDRKRQAQLGAKGGSRHTDKQLQQRAVLAKGPRAAAVVRTAEATGRAAMIVYWHEQGLSRRQIAERMDVSESTVKRALRAHRNATS